MSPTPMHLAHLDRIRAAVLFLLVIAGAYSCGSSATTSTGPSAFLRCGVTVQVDEADIPAQGGGGAVRVTAARECQWTASVDGQWLSIKSGVSGQGDGVVEFAAASNGDPVTRRGAVIVNGQRAELNQAPAPCSFVLSPQSSRFGQGGGSSAVEVRASSAMCEWTATTTADWIRVRTPTGQGTAQVPFDVEPTTGLARAGTIVIAGQQHSVTQSEGCTYTIEPSTYTAPATGARGSIAISTGPACPWTASSNVSWLRFAQDDGRGPTSLSFTVDPSSGPDRSGGGVVAGQPFSVTQTAGCSYAVQPSAHTVAATGGTVTISVSAGSGCAWTASVDVPWVSIQGNASGIGNGSITLAVAPTTGPARTGSVTVAGTAVTISQGAGCSYAISPAVASVPAAGGSGRFSVTAPGGCTWSATSSAAWLTITSGASGAGTGEVQYAAAPTAGGTRVGTISVGGQTFTLTQEQGCSYSLSPTSQNVPAAGGTGTANITTSSGCPWTAASNVSWLTVTSPATGTGNGSVTFSAAAHTGPPRSGTLTIAGLTFTVNQGAPCTFTITPEALSIEAAGGHSTVAVTTSDGCGWTASSGAAWIRIASGDGGAGNGTVELAIDANTGPQRTGTATIAGRTLTVNQSSGCAYALQPASYDAPAAASTVTVNVSTAPQCTWAARPDASWLSINGSSEGTGSGAVQVAVAANTTPARSGSVLIGGQMFAVTQASGCTITLNQTSRQVPANGGTRMVDVAAGAGCAWTAVSQVSWISVTRGTTGSGNGTVEFSVEPNTSGAPRTGTIVIGGVNLLIEQQ